SPGAGTQFIPNEPKIVERIPASELAKPARAAQLQAYRAAFGKIQGLPTNDVIGWTKQVAQHCIQCAEDNASTIHYDWQSVQPMTTFAGRPWIFPKAAR